VRQPISITDRTSGESLDAVLDTDMSKLMQQSEWFRRAADVEAVTPIAAGPPIMKKWWVKRADHLTGAMGKCLFELRLK
jgi:hypothetical protein